MDVKARNQLAIAMLVFAKLFGIAGLILGATRYRFLGGALLVFDAFLLAFAAYLGIRNMREEKVDEKDHKKVLERLIRECTLDQYLRDLRAASPPTRVEEAPRDLRASASPTRVEEAPPATPSRPPSQPPSDGPKSPRPPEYVRSPLAIRTPAT